MVDFLPGRVDEKIQFNVSHNRCEMITTVALIMEMDSLVAFEALARCMPVWIADTQKNTALKEIFFDRSEGVSITWFPVRADEDLKSASMRIAVSLDDHYNEDAQLEGYRCLLVFGIPFDPCLRPQLVALGFRKMQATVFGFAAVK